MLANVSSALVKKSKSGNFALETTIFKYLLGIGIFSESNTPMIFYFF